ncbi:MAG: protein kinase [Burkholderiales bacterium]|nr:protein kinase [Burkholderiales bacterium]
MQQIGKFQLLRVIGRGASGTVYLALDTFSGNEVALKVLDASLVTSSGRERINSMQFMNEASLAGKLSHPHIAAILEASVSEDSGYIALEYVPGGDLSQYTLPGQLLSPDDAIQVAFKACGALDYAFREGIVHRDIKPANILVVSGTNIKVADFGAAYQFRVPEARIANIGSPAYMSPEQIRGEPLGQYSDMFSLGAVLYQLFSGQRPFVASKVEALLAKIVSEQPVAPSSLRPEVGANIDEIVLKMIAKAPQERYPSWAELALDFAKAGRLSVYQRAIQDSEKFIALKKVQLLDHLDDAEIWELVHAGRWSRLPPRTAIVREGGSGASLYFIGSGRVKVTKQGRLLNVLNGGECVGEMAYVKEGASTRQATVETMEDVLLVEFERHSVEAVSLRCRYQLCLALMHSLVDRLSLADERVIRAG